MPSLAQLLFEKACMKNELHYAKQHLLLTNDTNKFSLYCKVTVTATAVVALIGNGKFFCEVC